MRFSVKWAAASAVYVGTAVGVVMLSRSSGGFGLGALMFGMFFGGSMALPLAGAQLASALVTVRLLAGFGFSVQFGGFALLSLIAYGAVLRVLDSGLRPMGGLIHGSADLVGKPGSWRRACWSPWPLWQWLRAGPARDDGTAGYPRQAVAARRIA